jgi:hypothetical protein
MLPPDATSISYAGKSMFPHLLDGDILSFHRCGPYRRGDVIVYHEPRSDRYIIHRIVRINGDKIRTGGDNNARPDPYVLSTCDIVGKITGNNRFGEELRVLNGIAGFLWYLYQTRLQRQIYRILKIFRPLYIAASEPPLLYPLFVRWGTLRPSVLVRPDGLIEVHVCLNRRYAAWIHEREGTWHILAPYRLFIREADLPDVRDAVKAALFALAGRSDACPGYHEGHCTENSVEYPSECDITQCTPW